MAQQTASHSQARKHPIPGPGSRDEVGLSHNSNYRIDLPAIAKAYVDCVEIEERLQRDGSLVAEDLALLRADLHALLMQALRQADIPFTDRAHAAQLAYQIQARRGELGTRGVGNF